MIKDIKQPIKGTDIVIVNGNEKVINDLLTEYYPKIKALVNYNHSINDNIKEDCIQELGLDFMQMASHYNDTNGIKFSTFIYTCLKNDLCTILNKYTTYYKRNTSYEELTEDDTFDSMNSTLDKSDKYDEKMFSIFCNNNKKGKIVTLRYFDDCNLEEISKIVGITKQGISFKLKEFNKEYKKEWLEM